MSIGKKSQTRADAFVSVALPLFAKSVKHGEVVSMIPRRGDRLEDLRPPFRYS